MERCCSDIDRTEIFIERPKNLAARAQAWSNYKHNKAAKYLIGKQISVDSGFFDKILMADCILADRG